MVILENPPVYNIVFIVEGTANVGAYFDHLKSAYILQTLEYFNGGPAQEVDYGCVTNCSLYTLVTYYGSDRAPGLLSSCQQPMTSTHLFAQSLDHIEFASGSGDSGGHLAEGLSTALQVFDDLSQLREPNLSPQNHCILVCNSAPYQLTSQESFNYCGLNCEQMVLKMVENGINFSIISPRKIPALYSLFEAGGGESQSTAKNYTTDSRHLVLLKGFQLVERPVSPSAKKDDSGLELKPAAKPPAPVAGVGLPGSGLRGAMNVGQRMPAMVAGSNTAAKDIANEIVVAAGQSAGNLDAVARSRGPPFMLQPSSSLPTAASNVGQALQGQPGSVQSGLVNLNQSIPGSVGMNVPNVGQVIPGQMGSQSMNMPNVSSGVSGTSAMPMGNVLFNQPQTGSAALGMGNMNQTTMQGQQLPGQVMTMQGQQLPGQVMTGFQQQQRQQLSQAQHSMNQMGIPMSQHQIILNQQVSNPGTMTMTQPLMVQPQMSSGQLQISAGQSQVSTGQIQITAGMSQMPHGQSTLSVVQPTMSMGQQPVNIVNQGPTVSMAPGFGGMQPSGQQGTSGNHNTVQTMIPGASFIDSMSFPNSGMNIDSPMMTPGAIEPSTGGPSQQQQRTIWTGTLEWQEKQKQGDTGPRLMRNLPCQIFIAPEEMDINASKWPNKLTMNLIPNTMLQPLQTLFKNSRTVGFNFSQKDQETLNSLYRVMAAGFGGCVNILTVPVTASDVRVLMLLYSNRKRMFMGLIPNDQLRFVNGIRNVITRHKNNQQIRMQQAASFGGGGMPGMVVMPGQQVSPPMGAGGAPTNMVGLNAGGMTPGSVQVNMVGGAAQVGQTMVMGMPSSQMNMSGGQMQQASTVGLTDEKDRRNNMALVNPQQFQQVANDQQRQQFIAQQQQLQQQQQQQQQQMQTSQQLRHLLMNQPQMRQQLMMQQRARVPGPQQGLAAGPQQQSLGPNMNPQAMQNSAAQNFAVLGADELTFDL